MALLVLDQSNNNAAPDFKKIAAWRETRAGVTYRVDGVLLKASEGATFTDPVYRPWALRARRAGLRVGPYHYARPAGGDAIAEARHFVSAFGNVLFPRDFRPFLDLEENDGGLPWSSLVAWSRTFNQEVFRLSGHLPGIYASLSWLTRMKPDVPIGAALWLAWWSKDGLPFSPLPPKPWKRVQLHQFTSEATVRSPLHPDGVPGRVDINRVIRLRPLLAYPDELDL